MTSRMQRSQLPAHELFRGSDAFGGYEIERLAGDRSNRAGGHCKIQNGNHHQFFAGGQSSEGVQSAAEHAAVQAQVVYVVEENFGQSSRIEIGIPSAHDCFCSPSPRLREYCSSILPEFPSAKFAIPHQQIRLYRDETARHVSASPVRSLDVSASGSAAKGNRHRPRAIMRAGAARNPEISCAISARSLHSNPESVLRAAPTAFAAMLVAPPMRANASGRARGEGQQSVCLSLSC